MQHQGGGFLLPAGAQGAGDGGDHAAAHRARRHLLHQQREGQHHRPAGQRRGALAGRQPGLHELAGALDRGDRVVGAASSQTRRSSVASGGARRAAPRSSVTAGRQPWSVSAGSGAKRARVARPAPGPGSTRTSSGRSGVPAADSTGVAVHGRPVARSSSNTGGAFRAGHPAIRPALQGDIGGEEVAALLGEAVFVPAAGGRQSFPAAHAPSARAAGPRGCWGRCRGCVRTHRSGWCRRSIRAGPAWPSAPRARPWTGRRGSACG